MMKQTLWDPIYQTLCLFTFLGLWIHLGESNLITYMFTFP